MMDLRDNLLLAQYEQIIDRISKNAQRLDRIELFGLATASATMGYLFGGITVFDGTIIQYIIVLSAMLTIAIFILDRIISIEDNIQHYNDFIIEFEKTHQLQPIMIERREKVKKSTKFYRRRAWKSIIAISAIALCIAGIIGLQA